MGTYLLGVDEIPIVIFLKQKIQIKAENKQNDVLLSIFGV